MDERRELFRKVILKAGDKVVVGRPKTAGELREFYLGMYQMYDVPIRLIGFYPSREDLIKAYEVITDEQILASEERYAKLSSEESEDYLRKLNEFERESRKTRIWVSLNVA